MLIRHAILEMFKYLEPDSNHTPSQIEITRLQNLIANSCCFLCRKFFIKPDYFFTNYFYYLFEDLEKRQISSEIVESTEKCLVAKLIVFAGTRFHASSLSEVVIINPFAQNESSYVVKIR